MGDQAMPATATANADRKPRHHVEHVMGMAVSIDVRDAVDAGAIAAVVAWLHHVDDTFSTHKIDSPISRLGLGELELRDMNDEVTGVLALCEELYVDYADIRIMPTRSRSPCSGWVTGLGRSA